MQLTILESQAAKAKGKDNTCLTPTELGHLVHSHCFHCLICQLITISKRIDRVKTKWYGASLGGSKTLNLNVTIYEFFDADFINI